MLIRGMHGPVFMADAGGGGDTPGAAAGGPGGAASPGGAPAGASSPGGAAPPPVAFAESLPEDIRGEAAFRDIKSLPDLAKGYLHATRMVGGRPEDLIKVPTSPEDQAAWDAAFGKLGRPEKPDGYQFTPPKLPEGLIR